ncbi:hypothetical protein AYI69_g11082 [Smittium culicis]|uniref:YCII-related domain-containing protein n=1 Tax=Smittium culicis TaxID=133412 RepID=A0A1R1X170_9FUNG|nr:hypothetical protein AYI69_g11082 [Smittium culicis]
MIVSSKLVRPATSVFQRAVFAAKPKFVATSRLNFSTSASPLTSDRFFHVKIKDYTDLNCFERRMKVRDSHLKKLKPLLDNKTIVFGGALVSNNGNGEATTMIGSVLVVRADTEANVRGILESDQYAKNNVWDMSTLEISEIKPIVN